MKILIVTKDLNSRGGVAAFFRLFQKYFNPPDITVEFLAAGSRPKDYERRERRHFSYFRDLWNDLLLFRRRLRTDPEIEIVQVNPSLIPVALFRDALFLILARRYQKKTVVFFHGWRDDGATKIRRSFIRFFMFRRIFFSAERIVVLAERFASVLRDWGYPSEKLLVSSTGFDAAMIPKRAMPPPDMPLRLVYLGRISAPKGTDILVDALRRFAQTANDFTMAFYGHAADPNFLALLKAKTALEQRITFHGYIDGPEKYCVLSEADVFVLPSCAEGCPAALIEAAGAGCFSLATPVGAIPELLADSRVGEIFPIGGVEELSMALLHCAERLSILRRNAEYISNYAKERWNMPVIAEIFIKIYRDVAEEK